MKTILELLFATDWNEYSTFKFRRSDVPYILDKGQDDLKFYTPANMNKLNLIRAFFTHDRPLGTTN